jgi:hypothetical protein
MYEDFWANPVGSSLIISQRILEVQGPIRKIVQVYIMTKLFL